MRSSLCAFLISRQHMRFFSVSHTPYAIAIFNSNHRWMCGMYGRRQPGSNTPALPSLSFILLFPFLFLTHLYSTLCLHSILSPPISTSSYQNRTHFEEVSDGNSTKKTRPALSVACHRLENCMYVNVNANVKTLAQKYRVHWDGDHAEKLENHQSVAIYVFVYVHQAVPQMSIYNSNTYAYKY